MEAFDLKFVTDACAGEIIAGRLTESVNRVCTDSRKTQPGDLFVALRGDKFDGHSFLNDVAAQGAVAVLIESGQRPAVLPKCAVITVAGTRKALGELGAAHRRRFDLPVVAVGGSNGKTTTKELIASVMKQKFATLWSEASFNNDIGVPMTLLRLERIHKVAVLEVGTNHPGELAPLVQWIQPRFGVVTSIGREHLEFFGDLAGVVVEEGMLAEELPSGGKLFLDGDSEWADHIARRTRAHVVRVGFGEGNDWRARNVRVTPQGTSFRVQTASVKHAGPYRVGLVGRYQVQNALYAIALGAELGLSREVIQAGLAACAPAKMRMEVSEIDGVRVLDDAYNANADSMLAALQVLQALPCKGRRVAVLGDMAELGAQSEAAHAELGRNAARLGVSTLFAVGRMAGTMAAGAREAGLNRVLEFGEVDAAGTALKSFLKPGDTVLLKASRTTRLERVTMVLRGVRGE